MKLKTNPVEILIYLSIAVWLVNSLFFVEAVEAAEHKDLTPCKACHTTLREVLPKDHKDIRETDPVYCIKCHQATESGKPFKWILHYKHYADADSEIDCKDCHFNGGKTNWSVLENESQQINLPPDTAGKWVPYFKSWAMPGYMDHEHARKGMTCNACHGVQSAFAPPTLAKCIECHKNYSDSLPKSNDVLNPHRSHLESLSCMECHKAHEESINYCNSIGCHDFNFKFPYPNKK